MSTGTTHYDFTYVVHGQLRSDLTTNENLDAIDAAIYGVAASLQAVNIALPASAELKGSIRYVEGAGYSESSQCVRVGENEYAWACFFKHSW
jgi:hypothetical protein